MSNPGKGLERPAGRQKPDVKPPADEKKAETLDDYLKAMVDIGTDLMYVGFSSEKFRKDAKEKKLNSLTVVKVVTAYAQIGNSVRNCIDKRRSRTRDDVAQMLYSLNERPSRFAIAFLPVTFMVRRQLKARGLLAPRFPGLMTDTVLQDPAFTGWQGEQLREFLLAFDKALAQTGVPQQHGPDQVARWIEISRAGYNADKDLVEAMKTAADDNAVIAWLRRELGEAG
jgi:hypothetical protein